MKKNGGFTLLEMMMVMIIVGLIIGAIFVGRSLIRASQMQGVLSDIGRYNQAVHDFKAKYLGLPGDFVGAQALWGTPAAGCPAGANNGSTDTATATCDGNGNGLIEGFSLSYENFRAWQQLASAGMVDGSFSGVAGPGGNYDNVPGVNIPMAKLPTAGYAFAAYNGNPAQNIGGGTFSSYFFTTTGTQFLIFGGHISGSYPYNPVLTPQEALLLDTKMDDGLPATGSITTYKPNSGINANCATTSVASTAKYNTGYSQLACSLLMQMTF